MFAIIHKIKVFKIKYVQEIPWPVHPENASGWAEGVCGLQTYFVWTVDCFKKCNFLFDPTFKNKTSHKNWDFRLLLKKKERKKNLVALGHSNKT
jgi:hypothetical protein